MNENKNLFDYLSDWWENRKRANTSANTKHYHSQRLAIGGVLLMAACVLLFAQNAWASTDTASISGGGTFLSDTIHYQGYLSDLQGQPINSSLDLLFRIYTQQTGGTPEWQETHPGIVISNGMFSVRLGSLNPFPSDLFSQENDLWLGIIIQGEELTPREPLAAAAYAINTSGGSGSNLPVGTVISWWRPDATTPLPSNNWMIADGSAVTDVDSPYNGQNLPDLTDKFIMGVGADQIGQTGGSNWLDLSHSHGIPSHHHSVSGNTSEIASMWDGGYYNAGTEGYRYAINTYQTTWYTRHNHNLNLDTGNWSGDTLPESITADNRPEYIGLVYLIKVK